ncbi:YybS family protein [Clostridium sp.]|uniref:YybS family protein n=1 Tax=Clostridium sp. TaxID=1506 RepID=UPI003464AE3C
MYNKKHNTQSTVEVGIMSALIIVMFMIVTYVPVIGGLFLFVIPLPITVLFIKHNYKVSLAAIIVSSILIAILNNPIQAIGSAILYGSTGLTIGYCIKNNKSSIFTIGVQGIVSLIGIILNYSLTIYVIMGTSLYSIIETQINAFKSSFDMVKGIYESAGVPVDSNPMFNMMTQITPELILTILPGAIIIAALLVSYFNYIVTKNVLKRLRIEVNSIRPFSLWYIDNRIGALLITIVILGMMIANYNMTIGHYIFNSSVMVLNISMILIGMAVITYYLRNKFKLSKGVVILILVFAFMNPSLSQIIFLIGIGDLIFDFRKLDENSLSNALEKYVKKKLKK